MLTRLPGPSAVDVVMEAVEPAAAAVAAAVNSAAAAAAAATYITVHPPWQFRRVNGSDGRQMADGRWATSRGGGEGYAVSRAG